MKTTIKSGRVAVVFDHRFASDESGRVWSYQNYNYDYWCERYLTVFSSVRIIGRRAARAERWNGVSAAGPEVEFRLVSSGQGGREWAWNLLRAMSVLRHGLDGVDAVVVFVPSVLGALAGLEARRRSLPYGCEVVGNGGEAARQLRLGGAAAPIAVAMAAAAGRITCWHASSALYVTREVLQKAMPCGSGREWHATDVRLTQGGEGQDRVGEQGARARAQIGVIAMLEQPYKGIGTLLRALATPELRGWQWECRVVGDGRLRLQYETEARNLGLEERVRFLGFVPRNEGIDKFLSWCDLFVLPSWTEGMPRALLEAMAAGCAAVATAVGGVPELLSAEWLVPPHDCHALAEALARALRRRSEWIEIGRANQRIARSWVADGAAARRTSFLRQLQAEAEEAESQRR